MKLYKLVNETTLRESPKYLKIGNKCYTCPSSDILKKVGYMELVDNEPMPKIKDNEQLHKYYEIVSDKIVARWNITNK